MPRIIEFIAKLSVSTYPYFSIHIPVKVSEFYKLIEVYKDRKEIKITMEIP